MKILNNKLIAEQGDKPIKFVSTPNHGGVIIPKYLIIHYTAGRSAQSSIDWMSKPEAKASAHLVIGLDGKITQMVDFNKSAWHAGVSKWDNLNGLNGHSIGIELDNPGRLTKVGNQWRAWFQEVYPENKILEATHKHQNTPQGWHIYTPEQIEACIKISQLLVSKYALKDVLGHEDIAPFRKEDPGPAFPMESFKSAVLGRQDDVADIYKVNRAGARLRSDAEILANNIIAELALNTKVEFIKSHMGWYNVFVVNGTSKERQGWIHSSLLTKI